jgi:hypothetical protein
MLITIFFCILLYLVAAAYDLLERKAPRWIWLIAFVVAITGIIIDNLNLVNVLISLIASGAIAVYLWKIKSGLADIIAVFLLGLIYPIFLLPLIISFLAFVVSIILSLILKSWKCNIPFIVPLVISMVTITFLMMFS